MNYRDDLRPEEEHEISCVNHPKRKALALGRDDEGKDIPLCYDCWMAKYRSQYTREKEAGE